VSNFLVFLLSAGGAAFVTAVIAGLRSLSTARLESEAALIKRLGDSAHSAQKEADRQRERAERAERYAEKLRLERDAALDRAAHARRLLIKEGIEYVDPSEN
jgi:hypothetical protein